jgi:hypothetical protein
VQHLQHLQQLKWHSKGKRVSDEFELDVNMNECFVVKLSRNLTHFSKTY